MSLSVDLQTLDDLRPSDTVRQGKVISLNWISRIFFAVRELFLGGWAARDREAFREFSSLSSKKIEDMKGLFERAARRNLSPSGSSEASYQSNCGEELAAPYRSGETPSLGEEVLQKGQWDQGLSDLASWLKVAAKIANSSWGKSLQGGQSQEYDRFQRDLGDLRNQALPHLDRWIEGGEDRRSAARWIRAEDSQRRFAALKNLSEVPYKFEEIPAGAVLITDPEAYLQARCIQGKKSLLRTVMLKTKAFVCWFFTGMRHTHAELSLGNAESFDLDKKKGAWLPAGETLIQQRTGKTFYGSFVVPRKEAMLAAYNQRFPGQTLQTFDELWAKIEQEARRSAPLIQVEGWDIVKTALPLSRPDNYDCTLAWNPGVQRYGCSATVSALFSKFGIDIGKEFSKMDRNVTPKDFFHSSFFVPSYVIL